MNYAPFLLLFRRWVLDKDDGTADMREVSDPIFEGSQSKLENIFLWLLDTLETCPCV